MNCPKCTTANSENAKFCKSCGFGLLDIAKQEPVLPVMGLQCLKCGVENSAHAKFCKACGTVFPTATPVSVPPPVRTPPPIRVPSPVPIPEVQKGVACYKCKTINNLNAKFCKACGVTTPSTPPVAIKPKSGTGEPDTRNKLKKQLLMGAGVAACVLVIGGAYWIFAGSAKPKASATTPNPAVQTAPESPTAVALPAVPAASPAVITDTAASPPMATSAPAVIAEPAKADSPEQEASKSEKQQSAASVVMPVPAITKAAPDEAKQEPSQAERDTRVAARKRQAERDQLAKQRERDKVNMNKANRTLDDLLK